MQEAADRFFQPRGLHRIARGGNRRGGNGFFAFLFDPELLTGLPNCIKRGESLR